MTRVNILPPEDLTNEWLVSDWRESPRVINNILSGRAKLDLNKIPVNFTLNTGHETFFRNKLLWLYKRHNAVCAEMDKRGIKRSPLVRVAIEQLNPIQKAVLLNDWQPTNKDCQINIERLQERFDKRKKAYYLTNEQGKTKIDCEYSFSQYLKRFEQYY